MNIPTCIVCESEQDVREIDLGAAGILTLPFCKVCFDSGRAKAWLATEFEEAMMEDPTMHKNSDGTWSERKPV